ncbi:MAG: helix-turn-helix transcriptional regulator [Gemmatimonadota bacterium]
MSTERLPRMLRTAEVAARLGLSRTTIWRLSKDPSSGFPQPRQISPGAVAFSEEELVQYLALLPSGGGVMRGRKAANDGDG